jgi:hypothetical protein
MTLANNVTRTAALLVAAAIAQPVAAQQKSAAPIVPVAPVPAPPAWTVSVNDARGAVQVTATAKGGTAQFVGGCIKSADPGFTGAISGYEGGGLRTDGQIEHVSFYVQGGAWQELYSVRLQYSAANKAWEIAKPLAPVFLNSFSRGATLAVVNSRNEQVLTFDLTGSTAAVQKMRTVCGIPVGRI